MGLILMGTLVAFAAACVSWEIKEREKEFYILLLIMTGIGQMTDVGQVQVPHRIAITADAPEGAGLLLGWWLGGGVVLRFFWAKWRRDETMTRRAPRNRAG